MDHTKAVINEGVYNFAQEHRQTRGVGRGPMKSSIHAPETDIFQRFSSIIPKV
jgi:hypothetical protein